ncbi:MAG: phosphohistidine phosphatase SixA [Deltaproteobacteria bacterium]
MNLYLVQHGEAVGKDVDPERPLAEFGRQEVGKVAQFAAKNCGMELSHIHHSGKLRARQTAEILAAGLGLHEPVQIDGLAPLDDPSIWSCRLAELKDSVMLVGHLPHLAKLAGTLLCGGEEKEPVAFRMGGMVALAREEGKWSLQWMIVPGILKES